MIVLKDQKLGNKDGACKGTMILLCDHDSGALREIWGHSLDENLPQCFQDHHAAPSTIFYFIRWVKQADETDNGIIPINIADEQRQGGFSRPTIYKVIHWLEKHHLLMCTKKSPHGRIPSHYFIRWSFKYNDLSTRKTAVNSPKKRSVNPFRRNTYKAQNNFESESHKSCEELRRCSVSFFSSNKLLEKKYMHKISLIAQKNHNAESIQKKKMLTYAIARLRDMAKREDISIERHLVQAFAHQIKTSIKKEKASPGEEFQHYVSLMISDTLTIAVTCPSLNGPPLYMYLAYRDKKHKKPFLEFVNHPAPSPWLFEELKRIWKERNGDIANADEPNKESLDTENQDESSILYSDVPLYPSQEELERHKRENDKARSFFAELGNNNILEKLKRAWQ